MALITGMLIFGNTSTGILIADSTPTTAIKRAMTTNVRAGGVQVEQST
jgi:hypothetical protein